MSCLGLMSGEERLPDARDRKLLLGVDTCGLTGSVALGKLKGESVEVLGETALEGRNYSATLVAAVGELLAGYGANLSQLRAIVVVNGPGSFTGVRVGLAAVKGLAEPLQIPVVAVSRLAVLAAKAGVESAALDAHRHEVYFRLAEPENNIRDLLTGKGELAAMDSIPSPVAVCDTAAESLLKEVWPTADIVAVQEPTASDALHLCAARILRGEFADLALLDGHYLRRSDAEIFGDKAGAASA